MQFIHCFTTTPPTTTPQSNTATALTTMQRPTTVPRQHNQQCYTHFLTSGDPSGHFLLILGLAVEHEGPPCAVFNSQRTAALAPQVASAPRRWTPAPPPRAKKTPQGCSGIAPSRASKRRAARAAERPLSGSSAPQTATPPRPTPSGSRCITSTTKRHEHHPAPSNCAHVLS